MVSTRTVALVVSFVAGSLFLPPNVGRAADGPKTATVDESTQMLKPGPAIEYRDLAFFPKKWKDQKQSTRLIPWEGRHIVLLTTKPSFDGKVMKQIVQRLDAGWKLYADLVGQSPRPFKQIKGKTTIAAVPDANLTCGFGCGYLGATGIEVAGFYLADYPLVVKNPQAFPHYYFYEMGRNYYVFGDRHSQFTTGYAVFMRYVCMDALHCQDNDGGTRKIIEQAEEIYSQSRLSFLQAFTIRGGLDEKTPRLKGKDGLVIQPSDQPVMYASIMLKLRRDHGGDAWVKAFLKHLARCPEIKADKAEGALQQSLHWAVAASCAARKNLTDVFVRRWRLPLGQKTRDALQAIDWKRADLTPKEVLKGLPIEFTK